jgi:sugar phosphate permease
LVARFTPSRFRHSAYGLKFILAFGVGSLGVKIVGWINASWGNETVFVVLGFTSAAIVCVAIMLIWWTNRSKDQAGHGLQPEVRTTG